MVLKNWLNIFAFSFVLILASVRGQEGQVLCINPEFQEEVNSYLSYEVPIISIADAYTDQTGFTFLDAREIEEYNVSHIKDAIHIGYGDFDIKILSDLDKSKPIIIYCSIGYRSEQIGKKLIKDGFKNVHNLYGSIFEWVNQHHPIYDTNGNVIKSVHTYNKKWSKWVQSDDIQCIWE